MTLYEINQEIAAIIDDLEYIDEETGEVYISEEALARLQQLNIDRDVKLENIGAFIKNLDAEVKAMKDEIKNLRERIGRKERKAEQLAQMVNVDLQAHGETKKEFPKVAYSFRKSTAVEITDEEKLPKEYMKVTYEPSKTEIKKAIQKGLEVPGAELVEKQNLQIK